MIERENSIKKPRLSPRFGNQKIDFTLKTYFSTNARSIT